MIKYLILFCVVVFLGSQVYGQGLLKDFPESFEVRVSNPLNASRENVKVLIPVDPIPGFNEKAFVVTDGGVEIPSQYNTAGPYETGIVVVLNAMSKKEKRNLIVRYNKKGEIKRNYPKKTQAELSHKVGGSWKDREYIGGEFKNVDFLRVPPEHKDHSWFIRYEGPGWESDKVGYRFYLDQRNATDAFGKLTPEVSLQMTGLDGFDSYHNMQPWGMDVLKVGKSLGVGTIGTFANNMAVRVEKTDSVTCRITSNGPVFSSILTKYYGWSVGGSKTDLESRLSIHSGTRLTCEQLRITGNISNICTGLVKDAKAKLFSSSGEEERYGYLATWGPQSLNSDDLGIAVFFDSHSYDGFVSDKESHIVKLLPSDNTVEYYFLAAWSKEPNGIKDEKQFLEYLNATAAELALRPSADITKK